MRAPVKALVVVLVVAALAAGAGIWWFLRDDAPAEVSLDAAREGVADTPDGGDAAAAEGIEGTWAVDPATASSDPDATTGTFVGFRVQEELAGIGSTTAVGRTGDVVGTIEIEGSTVTAASFTADLTTIRTNDGRRDRRVQDALETSAHPTAAFELTQPIELGPGAAEGVPQTATAVGELTVRGVTQPVELAVEAQLVGATIVVVASTDLTFSDFGVAVPRAPIVLSADDHGVLELQLHLTRSR